MNRHPATWQWDDVRFFLAVARTGSLSSAARMLRVGHVTVGRRIALLYASRRYLAKHGTPRRGQGLGDFDVITYTGAPAAARPFFMGESLEGARVAMRCDNPLVQMRAAADHSGIAELACFLGDAEPDVVRVWPDEPPALRTAWLVVHQDLRRSARIKVVASAITDAFHRQLATLRNGHAAKRSATAALART